MTTSNESKTLSLDALPEKIKEALDRVEVYYDRVMPWLAHMYDPKTGGFYMTMSGKQDPDMEPAVEMTDWGLGFIKNYARIADDMPDEVREKFIQFFYDRQDPKTGLFIDKQGPVNERETARNQSTGLAACRKLGVEPKYVHPSAAQKKQEAVNTAILPEFMSSPEAYVEWISQLPWEEASWGAGDKTQASQQYIRMLPADEQEKYKTAMFDWLESHQYESGLWSTKLDFNSVSGIFKVALIYGLWNKELPRYDACIDTIFECYKVEKTANPFFVRNPISVLNQMCSYGDDVRARVQNGILENIDAVTASFNEFLCPDGAFSAGKGRSMRAFGGVVGSHQLNEGDIDATLMMLIARNTLYSIFGVSAPPLEASDFWNWITKKKPLPNIYR